MESTITQLAGEFGSISEDRKSIGRSIAAFVESELRERRAAKLVFICTHNSRRSHIAQIWAQTAASWFSIANVESYSGGTEATEFNQRAVTALNRMGFRIVPLGSGSNVRYRVQYSDAHPTFDVFSKRFDDTENPAHGFAAIMTCTHADENCPLVPGASARFSLPFDDPKDFDGTLLESEKYHERCLEIGRELLYAFSLIKGR